MPLTIKGGPISFDRAFQEVFDQQFESLFRYMDRLSGDPDLAADIAQETFVRLYERGSMPDDVRPWLGAVASNLFRDERRLARRRAELLARQSPEMTFATRPADAQTALETEERRAEVRRALDLLPVRERQLLLLRHEGYSYRELAQAVGVAETSVGTLLVRATAAFAKCIGESDRASA